MRSAGPARDAVDDADAPLGLRASTRRHRSRSSVVDEIHERLSKEILEGSLHPGDAIVVATLTEQLGASVVPVREALRRLEGEGLVVFENNRGARVTDISLDDLRDIYQARRVMEPAAIAAGIRAQAIDLDALREAFDRMAAAYRGHTYRDAYHWHRQFHELLVTTRTVPRLERFVLTLLDDSRRYLRLAPGLPSEAEALVGLHEAILDCVIAGDAPGAAAATERHMDYSLSHLEHRRIHPAVDIP